jgi:hypothetical protein
LGGKVEVTVNLKEFQFYGGENLFSQADEKFESKSIVLLAV